MVGVLLSLWCVGFGAALVGRYRLMLAWIAALAVATLACTISVWCLVLPFAVWIGSAVHAYPTVRAADRGGAPTSTPGIIAAIALGIAVPVVLRGTAVEAFKIPSSSMYPTLLIGDHIYVNKLIYGLHIPFSTVKLFEGRKPERGEVIVFTQPCEPDRDYLSRVIATEGQTVEIRCNVVYIDGKPVENPLVRGEGCVYEDQDEMTLAWSDRQCSEYVERVGSREYHIYHDPRRPQRDEQLAREGSLMRGDSRDFPMVDGTRQPPSCPLGADGRPVGTHDQKPGQIVVTRQNAGACELQMHYVVPEGHVFVLGDNRANSNDSRYWGSVPMAEIKGRVIGIWFTQGRSGSRWDRLGAIR